MLSEKNKHHFDSDIKFQKDIHRYWIDNQSENVVSCTGYIHSFFEEFDTDKVIKAILESDKWMNDETYKYYKMPYEVIKFKWKNDGKLASESGTNMHEYIEQLYEGIIDISFVSSLPGEEFKQIVEFYNDHKNILDIYRTEWMIYIKELKIAGSVDAVFKNTDGTFTIGDWKRSKEIKYTGYDFGKHPFSHLQDCNYTHYCLQLNLYRIILEKFYGLKIRDMLLGVFHPNNKDGKYMKINIPIMQKEAELMLDLRKKYLFAKSGDNPFLEFQCKSVPENKGKRWSEKDDNALMDMARGGENLDIISEFLKRSFNSIKLRLIQNIAKKICEKGGEMDLQEFCKDYKQICYTDVEEKIQDINNISKKNDKVSKSESIMNRKLSMKAKPVERKELIYDNLSLRQKEAYDAISNGKNIFLTGSAGSGKSQIIKLFAKEFKIYKNIGVCSTTGTSAILINGTTLHSFLGIGLAKETADIIFLKICKRSYIKKRWIELDTLIIDEISMLSPELFDKLEQIARIIRKNNEPFGGIQLILTGDFLQLPNVCDSNAFCFEAKSWSKCIDKVFYLTEIFRQDDKVFQKVLHEARVGRLSDESIDILKSRVGVKLNNEYGIIPTKIYSLNVDVEAENENALNSLVEENSELEFYEYRRSHIIIKKGLKFVDEKMRKFTNCAEILQICIGAQVMLLYNMSVEDGLVNGSRGIVIGFENDLPLVKFLNGTTQLIPHYSWVIEENGEKLIEVVQIPLKVAYALTIHKCCSENTLIYTSNGLKRISKISRDNNRFQKSKRIDKLNSVSVMGKTNFGEAIQIYKGGIEETKKITTKLGYNIEGTLAHPILTYKINNGEEWKIMNDIDIGDYIVLKCDTNCFGQNIKTFSFLENNLPENNHNLPIYVNDKLCYIIGLLIGAGNYSTKDDIINFYSYNEEIGKIFNSYFKEQFNTECSIHEEISLDTSLTKFVKHSKYIREFLEWCGLKYVSSFYKEIPWVIFENNKECNVSCLKGLFDTCGSVNKKEIYIMLFSKQLATDIQNMLLNMGIISKLDNIRTETSINISYRISITGHYIFLFYKTIGFNEPDKQAKLKYLNDTFDIFETDYYTPTIPGGKNIAKDISEWLENKCSIMHEDEIKNNSTYYNNLTKILRNIESGIMELKLHELSYIREIIDRIYGLDCDDIWDKVESICDNNLFFDSVVNTKMYNTQVYDLFVPEDNTFIGNGIVNHNCQGISLDYVDIDLEDIFEYGQGYVSLSRVRTLDGLSLKNFNPDCIFANKKAVEFYENKL